MREHVKVAEKLRKKGWAVLDKGWPDLLITKTLKDGQMQIRAIEVKGPGDNLRPEQEEVIKILQKAGIDACVLWTQTGKETLGKRDLKTVVPSFVVNDRPQKNYEKTPCGGILVPTNSFRKNGERVIKKLYPCCFCGAHRSSGRAYVCRPCIQKYLPDVYWLHYVNVNKEGDLLIYSGIRQIQTISDKKHLLMAGTF